MLLSILTSLPATKSIKLIFSSSIIPLKNQLLNHLYYINTEHSTISEIAEQNRNTEFIWKNKI